MPTLGEFEKWLTTSQAASELGKSRQGVTWMIENRKLRAVKTQLGWLVDPAAVEAAKGDGSPKHEAQNRAQRAWWR